jgi:hypothetical protein
MILVVLSIILATVAYLAGSPAGCDRFSNPRTSSASSPYIRDLLLGGEASVPDERVYNLIPKRGVASKIFVRRMGCADSRVDTE